MAFLAGNQTAKGALDMALHDALARERGITLPELLGATRREVEVSYILGLADLDAAVSRGALGGRPRRARAQGEDRRRRSTPTSR